MGWIRVLVVSLVTCSAYASNEAFYDCMIDKMKGQPQSMQAIVARSCRAKFPVDRYVAVRQPFSQIAQYDYVVDRIFWRNVSLENNGLKSKYILLGYRSLPSAPNLGAITFKYSFQDCNAAEQTWEAPVSVSLKPIDLTILELESQEQIENKLLPKWWADIPEQEAILAYRTSGEARCLAFTHVEARIVD